MLCVCASKNGKLKKETQNCICIAVPARKILQLQTVLKQLLSCLKQLLGRLKSAAAATMVATNGKGIHCEHPRQQYCIAWQVPSN